VPWRNLRLFLLGARTIEPDIVMNRLEEFRFNGMEGISKFETWEEFNEVRFNYLFSLPRYIKISKLKGDSIEEERIKLETISVVEFHIRASGLVEAYGSPVLVERALEAVSVLGEIDPVVFVQRDFERVLKMASDVRKVRIYGTEDEHVVEVVLIGGGLSASNELKRFRKSGKIREISGKIELPNGIYSFSMTENQLRLFVRDMEEAQKDIEFLIDSLIS